MKTLKLFSMFAFMLLLFSLYPAWAPYAQSPATAQSFKAIARGVVEVEGGIIQLSAKKDGIIKEVLVEEGEHVTKGQVLAIQDDSVAIPNLDLAKADVKQQEAQLAVLRAQLKTLRNQMARLQPLVKIEAEPSNQYEELQDRLNELNKQLAVSKISIEITKKRVKTSESDLEQFKIRAPSDGTIVKKIARPGVGASTLNISTLFWLVPDVPKQVKLLLESKYHGVVQVGDEVVIYSVIDESKEYTGVVKKMSQVLATKSASLETINDPYEDKYFESIITFNGETELLIGQNVIVKFRDAAPR